ncbi:MAG: ATP-binding cassette domain-containing protein [Cyclobacteriaceae bacterium]
MVKAELSKRLQAMGGMMLLDVQLSIDKGSFVTLYGKSGAGKTSVLRMIAGLMKPDQGSIEVDGGQWVDTEKRINLKPQHRQAGFVFQDYALFPNMTVLQNLTYALAKGQSSEDIDPLLEMMELGDLRHSRPATLSGGQQQRVALARAIVPRPKLLLLDEPLSALDREIRQKLQGFIRLVHDEYQLTSIMVSHDLSEVLRLSDYTYVIESGKVIKEGPPRQILVKVDNADSVFDKIGEVISIEDNEVTVMIENQLRKLPSGQIKSGELKIGDQVWISPSLHDLTVRRLD